MSIFKEHIDIDKILINHLILVSKVRLYQTNRYYRNLIKPLINDYILVYTPLFYETRHNEKYISKAIKTNNNEVIKYIFSKYNFSDHNITFSISLMICDLKLETFKCVCNLKKSNEPQMDLTSIFAATFACNRFDIAQYIYDFQKNNIKIYMINLDVILRDKICKVCSKECLTWYIDIFKHQLHIDYYECFKTACVNDNFEIAEYLITQNKIDIRKHDDLIFRLVCEGNNLKMIKFLCAQIPQYSFEEKIKVTYKPIIN